MSDGKKVLGKAIKIAVVVGLAYAGGLAISHLAAGGTVAAGTEAALAGGGGMEGTALTGIGNLAGGGGGGSFAAPGGYLGNASPTETMGMSPHGETRALAGVESGTQVAGPAVVEPPVTQTPVMTPPSEQAAQKGWWASQDPVVQYGLMQIGGNMLQAGFAPEAPKGNWGYATGTTPNSPVTTQAPTMATNSSQGYMSPNQSAMSVYNSQARRWESPA